MKITVQIGVVLGICLMGDLIAGLLPITFPGSVISMILLFLLLLCGALRPEHIRGKADFLLRNMPVFFIPAGVGMMEHFDAVRGSILPLLAVCAITTVLTFGAAALAVRAVAALQAKARGRKQHG